jgi:hypothetical protein
VKSNRRHCLDDLISEAYAQGLCKVPRHLKPPYNKKKFAKYNARIPKTAVQSNDTAVVADIKRAAVADLKTGPATPDGITHSA